MTDGPRRLTLLLAALLLLGACDRTGENVFTREFATMGTVARIELHGEDATADLAAAAQTAVAAVYDSVNALMNTWSPVSEISRLNRAPADSALRLSVWLSACLARAESVRDASGGAFDPTAEPLMRLWGFHRREGRLPGTDEIAAARAQMGRYEHDPAVRRVTKLSPGTAFDLGGIAKGFAVDRAADALRALGCRDALVDLGSNLYCLGHPVTGAAWRVGIRDPEDRARMFAGLRLRDRAVATSGSYERFVVIDGVRYGHIMNPATGRPAEGLLSASVVAAEAELCDALSTALFVMGPDRAQTLLASPPFADVAAVLVLPPEGDSPPRVLASRSLRGNLELLPAYADRYTLEFF